MHLSLALSLRAWHMCMSCTASMQVKKHIALHKQSRCQHFSEYSLMWLVTLDSDSQMLLNWSKLIWGKSVLRSVVLSYQDQGAEATYVAQDGPWYRITKSSTSNFDSGANHCWFKSVACTDLKLELALAIISDCNYWLLWYKLSLT